MANKNIFVEGLYINPKNEKTPDFIKLRLSIKSKDFVDFLRKNTNKAGYVNIDLKKSKDEKLYFTLNTWQKDEKKDESRDDEGYNSSQTTEEDIKPEDIPF